MKKTSRPFSELKNPTANMTPSAKTITSTVLVALPFVLFFLNLFTGFIKL
jgi:hypothetical protein